jgi:hypothetical protein
MSIDAQIIQVHRNADGSGILDLGDRMSTDGKRTERVGIAGQATLRFRPTGAYVTHLIQCEIWGNDSVIMLGEYRIAKRISYTEIEFVNEVQLVEAIRMYWHTR